MKDQFDKKELKETIQALANFIHKQSYDIEMCDIEDLDMLDKVQDYLRELLDFYN